MVTVASLIHSFARMKCVIPLIATVNKIWTSLCIGGRKTRSRRNLAMLYSWEDTRGELHLYVSLNLRAVLSLCAVDDWTPRITGLRIFEDPQDGVWRGRGPQTMRNSAQMWGWHLSWKYVSIWWKTQSPRVEAGGFPAQNARDWHHSGTFRILHRLQFRVRILFLKNYLF